MKAIAICVLLLFAHAFKRVKLPTIAIAIVGRAITVWEALQKRSHETIYKTCTKIEAKGLRAIIKGGAIEKYWINEEFELFQ